MATDSAVSFVLEKFLSGTAVNLKAKQTILDAFMGHYGKLAMNNVGSHIVDKAFRIADVTRKVCTLSNSQLVTTSINVILSMTGKNCG